MNTLRMRLLAAVALIAAITPLTAAAQGNEVKVAVIAPFSGPWARQGDLMLKGAQMAIDDINAGGGIKALGGAKMKLVVIDAGDNIEKAKNAAQRMVAQESDVVGCTGAWLSSFTLGSDRSDRARRAALRDVVVFRSDHRARLSLHLPDLAAGKRAGEAGAADHPQARGVRRALAEDGRHRDGQHRGVGELRQAHARRRTRQCRRQDRGRRDLHAAVVGRHCAGAESALGEARHAVHAAHRAAR